MQDAIMADRLPLPQWLAVCLANKEGVKKLMIEQLEKRFEIVAGRIRLLMNPSLITSELEQLLQSCVRRIDFDLLIWAQDIDEGGSVPSIYYSIITSRESLYQAKSIDFCSPLARSLALDEYQRRKHSTAAELFDATRNSTAGGLAGRLFEEMIHRMFKSPGKKVFRARRLNANGKRGKEFTLVIENAENNSNGLENDLISVQDGGSGFSVTVRIGRTEYFDFKTIESIKPFEDVISNRIPNQLTCPDYDALLFPLFFRQDTISDQHPFAFTRVSNAIKACFGSADENWKKLNATVKSIGKTPWFAYFVPANQFEYFEYQPPSNRDGKKKKTKSPIVQIAVAVDLAK
jgi:hypothetical protein